MLDANEDEARSQPNFPTALARVLAHDGRVRFQHIRDTQLSAGKSCRDDRESFAVTGFVVSRILLTAPGIRSATRRLNTTGNSSTTRASGIALSTTRLAGVLSTPIGVSRIPLTPTWVGVGVGVWVGLRIGVGLRVWSRSRLRVWIGVTEPIIELQADQHHSGHYLLRLGRQYAAEKQPDRLSFDPSTSRRNGNL